MKWCANIAASLVLAFCALGFAADYRIPPPGSDPAARYPSMDPPNEGLAPLRAPEFAPAGEAPSYPKFKDGEAGQAKSSATSAGGAARERLGTRAGLNANAAAPLTSAGTPLSTLGGQASGTVQLTGASSQAFLRIFIAPGATGDIQKLVVSQDVDMDGSVDFNYTPGFAVSGVCANGFVGCTPGTWADCTYYGWIVEEGKLNVAAVASGVLGGCYCINNSCGGANLLWNNLSLVLNDLGGGAAGALTRASPSYQITQAKLDPGNMSIAFYGADLGASRPLADGRIISGTVSETQYYGRPGQPAAINLDSSAQAEALAQKADPKSPYSMVTQLVERSGTAVSTQNCQLNRLVSISSPTILCADPYPPGTLVGERQVHEYFRVYGYPWSGKDDCRIGKDCGGPTSCYLPEPHRFWMYHWLPQDGPVMEAAAPPENTTLVPNLEWWVYQGCNKKDGTDVGHYSAYQYWLLCTKKLDLISEELTNGCGAMEADPQCVLNSEIVDGVPVFRNGGSTGLVPQPSLRNYTGQLGTYPVTREWWRKERTYSCQKEQAPHDLSGAYERVAALKDSTDQFELGTTTLHYADRRKNAAGAWIADGGSITLNPPDAVSNCQPICKTRKVISNTDVTLSSTSDKQRSGPVGGTLDSNQIWGFSYKPCETQGCPLEPGEELIKDCQCLSEFAEATAILQTLSQAGKDLICSDGVRK